MGNVENTTESRQKRKEGGKKLFNLERRSYQLMYSLTDFTRSSKPGTRQTVHEVSQMETTEQWNLTLRQEITFPRLGKAQEVHILIWLRNNEN